MTDSDHGPPHLSPPADPLGGSLFEPAGIPPAA